jgi:pSer/pThr/pTyr-binding forkhead associated (FHA) protein
MSEKEPKGGVPQGQRPVTVLEQVEEIRRSLARGVTLREAVPVTLAERPAADAPEAYRPLDRPPTGLLTVIDDGDDEAGEAIRVRAASFVVGRTAGDLILPHDPGISGRHAEIIRREEEGAFRWYLRDLESTNGTFARASSVVLNHGQEVLLGRSRFRFEANPSLQGKAGDRGPRAGPSLVQLTPTGAGKKYTIGAAEVWIGRDPKTCALAVDDRLLDARHARIRLGQQGRWVLENAGSRNGVWARIHEVPIDRGGQFLCGEQRFTFRVL